METTEKKQLWRISLFIFAIITLIYVISFRLTGKIPVVDKIFIKDGVLEFITPHLALSRLWDLPLILFFLLSVIRLWQTNYVRNNNMDYETDKRKSIMLILLTFGMVLGIIGAMGGLGLSLILTLMVVIITGFISQTLNYYGLFYGLIVGLINCFCMGAEAAIFTVVISIIIFLIDLFIRKLFPKDLYAWFAGK